MKSKIIRFGKIEAFFLFLLIGLASLTYLYQFNVLRFFTYDQARDALYIKRILDGNLRLIGTQSSIPGLYTGPFYYYLMAPFLWAFKLNPIGLDFATALFALFSIALLFWLLKEETKGSLLALLFATLYAFSPSIVDQSRFAWNPNPLPFFTLLFLLSFKKILFAKEEKYFLPLALSLGAAVNLHYSGLAFFLASFLLWLVFKPRIQNKKIFFTSLFLLSLFFLPLLLFDLRHDFINLQNIFKYFTLGTRGEIPPPPFFPGLWEKISGLFNLVFLYPPTLSGGLTKVFLFAGFFFLIQEFKKKKTFFTVVFLTFLTGVFFSSLYQGSFFFFYLTFLYPVPFLVVALLWDRFCQRSRLLLLLLPILSFIVLKNSIPHLFPSFEGRANLLNQVSRSLAAEISPQEKFNLVALYQSPDRFDRNAVDYRYFLEINHGFKTPGWDVLDYQPAQTLYLISEIGPVDPLTVGVWELSLFAPQKIAQTWDLAPNLVIYKLEK